MPVNRETVRDHRLGNISMAVVDVEGVPRLHQKSHTSCRMKNKQKGGLDMHALRLVRYSILELVEESLVVDQLRQTIKSGM